MDQRRNVSLRARRLELSRNRRQRARGVVPSLALDGGVPIPRRRQLTVLACAGGVLVLAVTAAGIAGSAARTEEVSGSVTLARDLLGAGMPPAPVRPMPVDPAPVDPMPVDPMPVDPAPGVPSAEDPAPAPALPSPSVAPPTSSRRPVLPPALPVGPPSVLPPVPAVSTLPTPSVPPSALPSLGAVPSVPLVPSLGAVPSVPLVPSLGAVPSVPSVPSAGPVPSVAAVPSASSVPAALPGAVAPDTPAVPGAGMPEAPPFPAAQGASAPAAPTAVKCAGPTREVRDAAGLTQALGAVAPGEVIHLADGEYPGSFSATARGSADRPVTLCGGRNAVLTGTGGYTLHLNGAEHWRLAGFSIRGGQKGLVADKAQSNVIEGLLIEQTGEEALHLRSASSDNVVRENTIRGAGRTTPRFGEGIYIGSAVRDWPTFGAGGPDRSDRNVIERNMVTDTAAECVDIKEGTTGGTLRGNTFSGAALSGGYADSWVDVKGNGWTIADNVGTESRADGFQVHQIVDGWGVDNRFENNRATLSGSGYAINVTKNPERNAVYCSNSVTGGKALSNVTCTAGAAPPAGQPVSPV